MDSSSTSSRKRPNSDMDDHENMSFGHTGHPVLPNPPKRKATKEKAKPPVHPRQKATTKQLAVDIDPFNHPSTTTNTSAETQILARIRKCFAIANHAGTPEAEAKTALRMGSRLMSQYNVTQAEAFEQDGNGGELQYGGKSIVAITLTDNSCGKPKNYGFTSTLASVMCIFFDCKQYSTRMLMSIEWTFYGIASNISAAAMAFEMSYNLILAWSMLKKGISTKYSYTKGLADGLCHLAKTEKKEEEKRARENEAIAKKKRLEEEEKSQRLKQSAGLSFKIQASEAEQETPNKLHEFNIDGVQRLKDNDMSHSPEYNFDNTSMEFEYESLDEQEEQTSNPSGIFNNSMEEVCRDHTPPAESWASEMQLTTFRASAAAIADEYLQNQNIKLSYRTSKSKAPKDDVTYQQGREDSRKIDVRQRRLE